MPGKSRNALITLTACLVGVSGLTGLWAVRPGRLEAEDAGRPRWVAQATGVDVASIQFAEYRLKAQPAGRAWQLPFPGDGRNDCLAGDVQGLRLAPDSRQLVAQVDSGDAVSLCLYDFSRLSLQPSAESYRNVGMKRVTLLEGSRGGGAKGPASSSTMENMKKRASRGPGIMEAQPQWAPLGKGPRLLAFVSKARGHAARAVAMGDMATVRWQALRLDGVPLATEAAWDAWQPTFAPALAGPPKLGRLATVSASVGQGCGKGQLVGYPLPDEAGLSMERLRAGASQVLTTPCRGAEKAASATVADAWPAWDPVHDRLAFVRMDTGAGQNRLCLLLNPRGTPRQICDFPTKDTQSITRSYPVFSPDGNTLVFYSSVEASRRQPGEGQETLGVSRLEAVDLSGLNPGAGMLPAPVVLASDIRPNPWQGPPVYTDGQGRSWAVAVVTEEHKHNTIKAFSLGPERLIRTLETGLENVKVVDVARDGRGWMLAISAQGYARGGDAQNDKAYVMALSPAGQ